MVKDKDVLDDKMIKVINIKILKVEQDNYDGMKWITIKEADKLMSMNKELYV